MSKFNGAVERLENTPNWLFKKQLYDLGIITWDLKLTEKYKQPNEHKRPKRRTCRPI